MGKAKNGPHGFHRGRIGDLVYYDLDGINVVRRIGENLNPPTEKQLRARLVVKMASRFFRELSAFIKVGFGTELIGGGVNPHNRAMKYNVNNIIKGTYPNLEIDYDKVLVSRGFLKPAENFVAVQIADSIKFSWDTNPQMKWPESTDQVMMLAYFPESEKVVYKLFGNSRLSGSDELQIPAAFIGKHMETYISFVSVDRKDVADSTYAGSFNA